MYLNWDNIYNWGLLVLSFRESPIPTNWYYIRFFIWSANYSSLTCKLWILFMTFRDMWTVLKYYRIFVTVLYRKINFNRQPVVSYFFLVNKLYNLNVFKLQNLYFRHVQKFTRDLYMRPFNESSFTESSVLTIKYVFSFFWSLSCTSLVCNLYILIRFILGFWAVLIL